MNEKKCINIIFLVYKLTLAVEIIVEFLESFGFFALGSELDLLAAAEMLSAIELVGITML